MCMEGEGESDEGRQVKIQGRENWWGWKLASPGVAAEALEKKYLHYWGHRRGKGYGGAHCPTC